MDPIRTYIIILLVMFIVFAIIVTIAGTPKTTLLTIGIVEFILLMDRVLLMRQNKNNKH